MSRLAVITNRTIRLMQAARGVDIIYHRMINGVDTTMVLIKKAWTGTYRFRIIEGDRERVSYSDRDYLLPVVELDFGSGVVEPQRGDWIEEVLPQPRGTERFEVAAPFDEPAWRHSDPQGLIYRIHTKRMRS